MYSGTGTVTNESVERRKKQTNTDLKSYSSTLSVRLVGITKLRCCSQKKKENYTTSSPGKKSQFFCIYFNFSPNFYINKINI